MTSFVFTVATGAASEIRQSLWQRRLLRNARSHVLRPGVYACLSFYTFIRKLDTSKYGVFHRAIAPEGREAVTARDRTDLRREDRALRRWASVWFAQAAAAVRADSQMARFML